MRSIFLKICGRRVYDGHFQFPIARSLHGVMLNELVILPAYEVSSSYIPLSPPDSKQVLLGCDYLSEALIIPTKDTSSLPISFLIHQPLLLIFQLESLKAICSLLRSDSCCSCSEEPGSISPHPITLSHASQLRFRRLTPCSIIPAHGTPPTGQPLMTASAAEVHRCNQAPAAPIKPTIH